ncbi:MAG: PQQ-dependent sugar dehydrogenase [Gammaproteobacteria bacterium]|jgi:aldose sugar dehydrogenase|nr:PQQ-dependent sugar dehydrogenase [Gammaproteobacteria bacterium]MBT6042117.1 PQQ-dependent sugar dehydrogenase [Gammaproteobacteria bacterium]
MKHSFATQIISFVFLLLFIPASAFAQFAPPPIENGPWLFNTFEHENVKASIVARGLNVPFGMVFLPGTQTDENPMGDLLVSERQTGFIRHYRDGELLQDPVAELKLTFRLLQLFDINLHPDFSENGLLYFTWIKGGDNPDGTDDLWMTTAVSRGRWDGEKLVNLKEVFEADAWAAHPGGASSRGLFLPDGTFIFGSSHRIERQAPQRLDSHIGKTLRINDDGSAPADNPFYAVEGALAEIFTWGNRSVMGFAVHPQSGAVWELENGPQGGDEVNILRPGANYGWPLATFGRDYDGTQFNDVPWVEGTERPEVFWVPAITVAGMTFYTGDKFPEWENNLFVTSMMVGRIPGTGHLERVVFNDNGEVRRESMLEELGQRIRYVSQGPDGLLYLLTDHVDGALLKIEPGEVNQSKLDVQYLELSEQGITSPELFTGSDCMLCHRVDESLIGPSFQEIAAKYSTSQSNINLLVNSILEGGEGNWGDLPMSAHPNISATTARQMVDQILGLSTQ